MRQLGKVLDDLAADLKSGSNNDGRMTLVERKARERIARHLKRAADAPEAGKRDLRIGWLELLGVEEDGR